MNANSAFDIYLRNVNPKSETKDIANINYFIWCNENQSIKLKFLFAIEDDNPKKPHMFCILMHKLYIDNKTKLYICKKEKLLNNAKDIYCEICNGVENDNIILKSVPINIIWAPCIAIDSNGILNSYPQIWMLPAFIYSDILLPFHFKESDNGNALYDINDYIFDIKRQNNKYSIDIKDEDSKALQKIIKDKHYWTIDFWWSKIKEKYMYC